MGAWYRAIDKLPKDDTRVLVWINNKKRCFLAYYSDYNFYENESIYDKMDGVTHWMKLPREP